MSFAVCISKLLLANLNSCDEKASQLCVFNGARRAVSLSPIPYPPIQLTLIRGFNSLGSGGVLLLCSYNTPHGQLTLEHRFSSLTLRLSRTVFTSGIARGD
jgi:hypothetical protein